MFSPIVQEKKGCLTTFEEKKQEKVVKCFGSQILLVVYIFVGIGLYKGLLERGFTLNASGLAPRLPGVGAADRMRNPFFGLSGKIRFCKDVGNISESALPKGPSVRCRRRGERAERVLLLLSPLWPSPPPCLLPLRAERNANRAFLSPCENMQPKNVMKGAGVSARPR